MTPGKFDILTLILDWVGGRQASKSSSVGVLCWRSFVEVVVKHAECYRFKFRRGGVVCHVEGHLPNKGVGINGGRLRRHPRFANRS